jgi:NAD(P)-dependent dehydrogenase (short-subunit alcohol dehydrogenase family)
MAEPFLQDPRLLYKKETVAQEDEQAPASQKAMPVTVDCGEKSYEGSHQLENRRVLITGGDSGIGRAIAIAFAREGADVALQFLPDEQEDAEEVAEYIEKAGRKAVLLPFDFLGEEAPEALIEQAVKGLGGMDTVILNAAQQIAHESLADLPMDQVQATFHVNVISMFALVKAALPHLPAGGAIITTTSLQSFNPSETIMDYAATKAAITSFTISLAKQLAKKGIRVNGVAPGPIWTPLQLEKGLPEGQLNVFGEDTLLERAGQPVELAHVYVFLASNKASYITSQIYGVTGGEAINL